MNKNEIKKLKEKLNSRVTKGYIGIFVYVIFLVGFRMLKLLVPIFRNMDLVMVENLFIIGLLIVIFIEILQLHKYILIIVSNSDDD